LKKFLGNFNVAEKIAQISGKDFACVLGLVATRAFLALLNRDLKDLEDGTTSREKLKESLPRREALLAKFAESEIPEDILAAHQVRYKFSAYKKLLEN
jgi:hypothetical protein